MPITTFVGEDLTDFRGAWTASLKRALVEQNVSVAQLATALDVSPSVLYKRFRGTAEWPCRQLLFVSRRFGLSVDDALAGHADAPLRLKSVLPKGPLTLRHLPLRTRSRRGVGEPTGNAYGSVVE